MNMELKKRIYNAQCIGNVEPIEYMTPYPSIRSVIEGQIIKFSDKVIFHDLKITNSMFYSFIQQTSNWLQDIGLEPQQRIIIPKLRFPETEILLFSVWNMGCVAVLSSDSIHKRDKKRFMLRDLLNSGMNLFDEIKPYQNSYQVKYKPLLQEEALLTFEKKEGIRLSHYNLLINASGIQKGIGLKSKTRYYSELQPNSISWVIFNTILPIYSGCIYDSLNPKLTIGTSGNSFNIRQDLNNINEFSRTDIAICPENTACLSVGRKPIHLTNYKIEQGILKVKGHSVMMGYLQEESNISSFKENHLSLAI